MLGQHRYVIGLDECGTGAWAGPAAVGAVVARSDWVPDPRVRDSKKLTRETRTELVLNVLVPPAIEDAWVAHIPIEALAKSHLGAIHQAFRRLARLAQARYPDSVVVVDGAISPAGLDCIAIVKGDDLVPACSAASILAKVSRDTLMGHLAVEYPGYGFAQHVGYGTRQHRLAIERLGITPIHRDIRPLRDLGGTIKRWRPPPR